MDGYEQVGHELHLGAHAELTQIVVCAGKSIKNRRAIFAGLFVAAGVYNEILLNRLGPRTAEWTVQEIYAHGL